MQPTVEEQSQVADGHSLRIGPMIWPRAYFPSRFERAALVKQYIPTWGIATGHTAGFVFTGMGSPEPWTLLRHPVPAISPLQRTAWMSSLVNPENHRLICLAGLWLTCPEHTVMETLLRRGPIDQAATQLLMLTTRSVEDLAQEISLRRAGTETRARAASILVELGKLRATYPDITRYTS
jgi:hypothetical protein